MSERKLKLCIVMPHHWSSSLGGAEYQAKCIVEAACLSANYDIYFIARFAKPPNHNIPYRLIQIPSGKLKRKRPLHQDAVALNAILHVIEPDTIYQRVGCAYTGIVAQYAKQSGSNAIWHIARDDEVSKPWTPISRHMLQAFYEKRWLKYGIHNMPTIVAQTHQQADLLQKNYGRLPAAVIPNFHPDPKEKIEKHPPIKILWVANLKPIKQPHLFIRLARSLKTKTDAQFIMIGAMQATGRWANNLRREIKETPNLTYLGACTLDEVNARMAEAHVFINTSLCEGFPNTFIQAWSRQVPVISLLTNPDGILEKAHIGWYAGTFENLRKIVLRVINDNQLREKTARLAEAHARKVHSMRNTATLLELINAPKPYN